MLLCANLVSTEYMAGVVVGLWMGLEIGCGWNWCDLGDRDLAMLCEWQGWISDDRSL